MPINNVELWVSNTYFEIQKYFNGVPYSNLNNINNIVLFRGWELLAMMKCITTKLMRDNK